MKTIKLRNLKLDEMDIAQRNIKHFVENFSDRVYGVRNGCGYKNAGITMYVYQTLTMIVCVSYGHHNGR